MQIVVVTSWLPSLCTWEVQRREPVHPTQIVLYLSLEWRDQPSCHLLSLDWLRSLPVVEALHTKPVLISRPRGVLALEF